MKIANVYGYDLDSETLPESTVAALFSRGANHYFGNEQAAKVTARIKTHLRNGDAKKEVTRDMVNVFRDANEALVASWEDEARAKAMDAAIAGTVGESTRTAKLSTIEKVMRDVARDAIKAACVAKGKKMPKSEELSDLIEDLVTGPKESDIRAAAQKRLDAAAEITVNV